MRTAEIKRETKETDVFVRLDLDGKGTAKIDTGCGFLDHMLTLFASHGKFDLEVSCKGDTFVDYHHTVEDVGIALGQAFADALGDKRGINRYGDALTPMDEALVFSSVDFSGRSYLGFYLDIPTEKVGDFDTELVEEFWLGFVRNAQCALHLKEFAGKNSHHLIECAFKSAAKSFKTAVYIDPLYKDVLPSTKGVL